MFKSENQAIDTGTIPLPGSGTTKVIKTFVELHDDLTGLNLKSLLSYAIVWGSRKFQAQVGAKQKKKKTEKVISQGFQGRPFTFLINKYMVRGPFVSPDRQPQEVEDTLKMGDMLWRLQGTAIVKPLAILKDLSHYYIVYPNIHTGIYENIIIYSELKTKYTYSTLGNSVIKPINEVFLDPETLMHQDMKNYVRGILMDLVLLYAIGVDNISFSNIMVNTQFGSMNIIGIETLRTINPIRDDIEGNTLFYFVFGVNPGFETVDSWNELINPYIHEAILILDSYNLEAIGFTPEMIDRYTIAKALLNKAINNSQLRVERKEGWPILPGKDETVDIRLTESLAEQTRRARTSFLHYDSNPDTPIYTGEIKKENQMTMGYLDPSTVARVKQALPMSTPVPHVHPIIKAEEIQPKVFEVPSTVSFRRPVVEVPDIKPLALVKSKKVYGPRGGMSVGTTKAGKKSNVDSHKTYSGSTVRIMKVALRKYIQGGLILRAVQCATEIFRLHEIGDYRGPRELFKTMAVCALEDVSVANVNLTYTVVYYCNLWHKQTEKTEKKPGDYPVKFDEVAYLVWQMAESMKTTFSEDIWECYNSRQFELAKFYTVVSGDAYRNYLTEDMLQKARIFFTDKDPEPLWKLGTLFYVYLQAYDGNSTVWLNTYYNISYPDKKEDAYTIAPRSGKTDPAYIIFDIFRVVFSTTKDDIEVFTKMFKRLPRKHNIAVYKFLTGSYLLKYGFGTLLSLPRNQLDTIPTKELLGGQYTLTVDSVILNDTELGGETPFQPPLRPENDDLKEFGPFYHIIHG